MNKTVEIRNYRLYPNKRDEFHRLVTEQSYPLMQKWEVDVVAFGPSQHDEDSYCLIRAYNSEDHREESQDAFYSSLDWRNGPREAILPLLEKGVAITIEMDVNAIDVLRNVI